MKRTQHAGKKIRIFAMQINWTTLWAYKNRLLVRRKWSCLFFCCLLSQKKRDDDSTSWLQKKRKKNDESKSLLSKFTSLMKCDRFFLSFPKKNVELIGKIFFPAQTHFTNADKYGKENYKRFRKWDSLSQWNNALSSNK